MALWSVVNTLLLPQRVDATAPSSIQGSAVGLVGLIGIGIAVLIQPFAGRASDLVPDRRREFVVVGTALAIPGMFIFGWARTLGLLLLGYVLLQIAANIAQASFQAFIPDFVDKNDRGLASGVKNALTVVGAALGLLGARVLMAIDAGTYAILLYVAVVLAVTAGLTALWVPRHAPLEQRPDRGEIAKAISPGAVWSAFTDILRQRATFRRAVLVQFLFLLGTYPAQRFLLLYLRDRFGSGAEERASVGLAAAIALAAIAAGAAGIASDKIGRRPVLVLSVILAGIGFSPTVFIAGIAGGLVAIGTGAFQAVNWALLSDDSPQGEGASAFGVANIATAGAGALSGAFGPLVDLLNAVVPGGTYQVTFGVAAIVVLTCLWPLRQLDAGTRQPE